MHSIRRAVVADARALAHVAEETFRDTFASVNTAIAFYRKFGFAEAGSLDFGLGADVQRDIVMVRPIVRPEG